MHMVCGRSVFVYEFCSGLHSSVVMLGAEPLEAVQGQTVAQSWPCSGFLLLLTGLSSASVSSRDCRAGTGITKSILFPGIKYPQPARVCVNVHTIYMLPSLSLYTHPIYRYIDLCGVSDHSLLPSPLFLPSPLPMPRNTVRDPSSEWEGKMTRICVKVS